MENFNNNSNMSNNLIINTSLTSVISTLKTRREARWFAQSHGKLLYLNLGLFMPDFSCYNTEFLLMYGSQKKNVRKLNFIHYKSRS